MNRTIDINLENEFRHLFASDDFCCSIHISSSKYSHYHLLQILKKVVKGKLNKYLIGRNWTKRDDNELIHLVWFREGKDIFNSQVRGFHIGSSFIRKELRMKSTEVQRHYHVLVRNSDYIKNTKHCSIDMRNDTSTLIELQLRRIFSEFNSKNDRKLDVRIENNHHYDKSQQNYVTKDSRNIFIDNKKIDSDNWGFM